MIYQRLSKRQLLAMTWWNRPKLSSYDALICDGSVRSGKTLAMSVGFLLWSMRTFHGQTFAICGKTIPAYTENSSCHYSPEYWVGWILAYYQWYCGKPFSLILPKLRYQSLRNLYGVLHEADPSKAASVFDELLSEQAETNLARYRKARGLSQSQLANASGLSLRSIQLYEQRQNDINNAQYNRLQALAKTLGCKIEDLLE